jgi:hypothetical protein
VLRALRNKQGTPRCCPRLDIVRELPISLTIDARSLARGERNTDLSFSLSLFLSFFLFLFLSSGTKRAKGSVPLIYLFCLVNRRRWNGRVARYIRNRHDCFPSSVCVLRACSCFVRGCTQGRYARLKRDFIECRFSECRHRRDENKSASVT